MSKADVLFKEMCEDIIENGFGSEGQDIRAKWEDGTPAHTIKKFGVVNRYNLQEEFPALTLRPTALKSAFDELLWIWQKKSNNVNDLNSHIWDQWADEDRSIGKAYGYQIGQRYDHHKEKFNSENDIRSRLQELKKEYPSVLAHVVEEFETVYISFDQMDGVLYDLKHNPYSRRIIAHMYNFDDLCEMNLYPCAYSMTFNVSGNKLNAILNQRSQDILVANNWNVAQYALLVMMIAQVTGFEPGELVHVIADAHIYDRHIPIIKEMLERPMYPAPKVSLNPEVKNFYDFTVDDLIVEDYQKNEQIKNIPVAI